MGKRKAKKQSAKPKSSGNGEAESGWVCQRVEFPLCLEPSSLCGLAGFRVTLVQQCADLARQFNWEKWLF
jgi:predicted RNA-binding protein with PUA domain